MSRFSTIVFTCVFISCAPWLEQSVDIVAPLMRVERPAEVGQRWGAIKITDLGEGKFGYSDSLIGGTFLVTNATVYMSVQNLTEHSIKIVWDESAINDPAGRSSRIATGDMRRIDLGRSIPPSVILSGSTLEETLLSQDYITSDGISPFVTPENIDMYKGKAVSLLVAFEIQGIINEYTFIFPIQSAVLKTYEVSSWNLARKEISVERKW